MSNQTRSFFWKRRESIILLTQLLDYLLKLIKRSIYQWDGTWRIGSGNNPCVYSLDGGIYNMESSGGKKWMDVYIFVNFGWIQIVFTGNLEFPLYSSRHLCLHSSVLFLFSLSTRAFLPLYLPLYYFQINISLCIIIWNISFSMINSLFTFLPDILLLEVSRHLVIL